MPICLKRRRLLTAAPRWGVGFQRELPFAVLRKFVAAA